MASPGAARAQPDDERSTIVPDDREIHLVRNVSDVRAMSLHVYGADLTQRKPFDGRSIRVAGAASSQDQPVY